jgi:imidazolonepropionase-like amidohydrolase
MQGLGCHWEIWGLQSGGMTPFEALRSATLYGAQAIALQKDVGSIEAGKMADLIILDKNPLTDIRNTNTIAYAVKNGSMYEGETLNQVWPVEKKLEKQYWWGRDPQ